MAAKHEIEGVSLRAHHGQQEMAHGNHLRVYIYIKQIVRQLKHKSDSVTGHISYTGHTDCNQGDRL